MSRQTSPEGSKERYDTTKEGIQTVSDDKTGSLGPIHQTGSLSPFHQTGSVGPFHQPEINEK